MRIENISLIHTYQPTYVEVFVNFLKYLRIFLRNFEAHVLGIDAGSVSMSMGHTLEAHLRAYPYASKASTTNALQQARERLTA